MRLLALAIVLLLAGCSSPGTPPADTSNTTSEAGESSAGSTTTGGPPFCCVPEESARFRVEVEADGPFAVAVPFPHMQWCLDASAWMSTPDRTYDHVGTVEWREMERGDVLWMEGQGGGAVHELVLVTTNRGVCQTFRYDPWSIEPDRDDGRPEAFGASSVEGTSTGPDNRTTTTATPGHPVRLQVTVEHRKDACLATSRFEGWVGNDQWIALEGEAAAPCP